jgi:anti-sigma factor RsiW
VSAPLAFSCQDVVELVTEYAEGGLDSAERLAFERHVAICPPCRGYFAQMRKISRTAGGLHEEDLPEPLRAKLVEAFRDWRLGRSE